MLKRIIRRIFAAYGYDIRRTGPDPLPQVPPIPDGELYRPRFSPWLGGGEFKRFLDLAVPRTLVSADRCFVLYRLLLQALRGVEGDVWECGVYRGGTAAMLAAILADRKAPKKLYLFDTFSGMPATDPDKDWHSKGDFANTSLESVREYVGHPGVCVYRQGFIPQTFAGLESSRIALAHLDVDIYRSVLDCLEFIWPRLARGGFIVCDDYGFSSCPGARAAVDEFFAQRAAVPLCLPSAQAIIFKGLE